MRDPMTIAKLLIMNGMAYGKERDVVLHRHKLTYHALCVIADRKNIPDSLILKIQECAAELGWHFMRIAHEFCIIRVDIDSQWVKLTPKRLDEQGLIEHARSGYIDAMYKLWRSEEESRLVDKQGEEA